MASMKNSAFVAFLLMMLAAHCSGAFSVVAPTETGRKLMIVQDAKDVVETDSQTLVIVVPNWHNFRKLLHMHNAGV